MKKTRMIEWAMVALWIGTAAICQSVGQIAIETKDIVQGYINQSIALSIPFDKCYKVESEMPANQKFIEFKPTRVGFRSLKNYFLGNIAANISIFEQLRSPIDLNHRLLLVLTDYQIIIVRPNLVLIVQQSAHGFAIKNRYVLAKVQSLDRLNLYKISEQGLLTIQNKKQIYLLNPDGYKIFTLPYPSKITYVQQSSITGQFFAIQFMKGLSLYRLSKDKAKANIINSYDGGVVGLPNYFKYITHFSTKYYKSQGLIFVLDSQIGLVQLNVTESKPKTKIIIGHKMCTSFDITKRQNFVLLCQNQNKGYSILIRVYRYYDQRLKQLNYRKLQPILLGIYLTHIRATQFYYLIYSSSKVYIVWNTIQLKLPQILQMTSQINIGGLQSLFLNQQDEKSQYFYTIERGGFLHKYILIQQKAQLALMSTISIIKVIKLYLYGNCADLHINQSQNAKAQTCKIPMNILLKVTEQDHPLQQFSVNASIIVILITVFLLMTWICLKKYKGLQRQARRVMQNYHKAKINNKKN